MEANNIVLIGIMILIQFVNAGMNILSKLALQEGMSPYVLVAYRFLIAVIVSSPFAYVLERNQRPPFSIRVMLSIFGLAFLGIIMTFDVYYAALTFTSPTVATALRNANPCLTFLMAVLIRIEKVKIRSRPGQAKVLGTVSCLVGVLLFTLWRGRSFFSGFKKPLLSIPASQLSSGKNIGWSTHKGSWIKGSSLIMLSNLGWCGWLISQVWLCKVYPALLSLNVLVSFSGFIQTLVVALCYNRNFQYWRLQWNVALLAVLYCGVLTAVVNFTVTWCIRKRGPVFVTMFSPLEFIILAIFSSIAFAEQLHLGSLVGAILIVGGMYSYLWGKKTDMKVAHKSEDVTGDVSKNPDPETGNQGEENAPKETMELTVTHSKTRDATVVKS